MDETIALKSAIDAKELSNQGLMRQIEQSGIEQKRLTQQLLDQT